MDNTPYKKQISKISKSFTNKHGKIITRHKEVILNPLTLEKPYHNQSPINRKDRNADGKYVVFNHPLTREFVGKVKINGNNRANTCERGKSSRQFHSA